METVRLTTAQAIVKYLMAQKIVIDGETVPLFPGVYAIFGHGNVTCLGHALEEVKDEFPTWRGQNEQGMALAATAFAKACASVARSWWRPRRSGPAPPTWSPPPVWPWRTGCRCCCWPATRSRAVSPIRCSSRSSSSVSRRPRSTTASVRSCGTGIASPAPSRSCSRSRTRCTRCSTRPTAVRPSSVCLRTSRPRPTTTRCGSSPRRCTRCAGQRPDNTELVKAAATLVESEKPLIIAGGGVHWSDAGAELRSFAEEHNIPVVETVAGRTSMPSSHPLNAGTIGVTGCTSANALAAEADVVLAVGTRLQDFATGSWTVFANEGVKFVGHQHRPVRRDQAPGDPRGGRRPRDARRARHGLSGRTGRPDGWSDTCATETAQYHAYIDKIAAPDAQPSDELPTYAQVVGVVDRAVRRQDLRPHRGRRIPG